MIQLFGNCFGQKASTLYVGGACALAIAHSPSATKQALLESKTLFVHPVTLVMGNSPNRAQQFILNLVMIRIARNRLFLVAPAVCEFHNITEPAGRRRYQIQFFISKLTGNIHLTGSAENAVITISA